ncbi:Uncharacterised protein [Bordetella pertussis]|nr:Uncharacterised protein [Bordetella pertussis]CFO76978.1 Uncharacterised protein [Bordetella pertussis]CFU85768.1 Uncharacterised protein [Bordetella pertussis]CPI53102.1 Uncharacterised protein [Bordetella pertussis]CPL11718.1 Uncharacterised protein [Bordetella pertussis]
MPRSSSFSAASSSIIRSTDLNGTCFSCRNFLSRSHGAQNGVA